MSSPFPKTLQAMYTAQQHSPLFRLPLELRRRIFKYYAHDDAGCVYNYPSRQLRYSDPKTHHGHTGLSRTGRAAMNEMKWIALTANTTTFTPGLSHQDGPAYRNLTSKAARFEMLIYYSRWTKLLMLHYLARARYNILISRTGFEQLASKYRDFDRLVSRTCSTINGIEGGRSFFHTGSHRALLAWKPDWWSIPTEEDLSLLTTPTKPVWTDPKFMDFAKNLGGVKWYFSATAVALDFLKQLPREQRMLMSGRKIIIHETCKGAAYPESHVRGLIPYLEENPRLIVEMKMSIWDSLLPSFWLEHLAYFRYRETDVMTCPRFMDFLGPVSDWLAEIKALDARSVPTASLDIVLEGTREETVEICGMIKKTAALQQRITNMNPGTSLHFDEFSGDWSTRFRILPDSFQLSISGIIERASRVRFDGDPREWVVLGNLAVFEHWYQAVPITVMGPSEGLESYIRLYEACGDNFTQAAAEYITQETNDRRDRGMGPPPSAWIKRITARLDSESSLPRKRTTAEKETWALLRQHD